MLTPKFKLTQDQEKLFLWMHVPYIKYEEAQCEIDSEGVLFFSATPYYLRLHLPGEVLPELGPSRYDVDEGDLTITLKKKNSGESFEGLDMLTWLLTPRECKVNCPSIEVINHTQNDNERDDVESDGNNQCDFESSLQLSKNNCDPEMNTPVIDLDDHADAVRAGEAETELEWYIDQKVKEPEDTLTSLKTKKTGCGFALCRFNFSDVSLEAAYLIDVKDPNSLTLSERRQLREKQENDKFDFEHYLADLFDDKMIKEAIIPTYPDLIGKDGFSLELSEKEMDKLTQLPKKEYLIESEMRPQLFLGLLDLLFSYSYNYRFSFGDDNVEADWIICKLSSTLSWCDSFCDIKDVVIACARRTLCFPLYRNWKLFEKVLSDVTSILKCGKTQILKCLLGIHAILQKSEDRHVLNDLYVTDYCVWIQSVSSDQIEKLASELSKVVISKDDVGFRLVELEEDARHVMEESDTEDGIEHLAEKIRNVVKVCDADEHDSDDDEDNSSSESESNDSSSESDSSEDSGSDNSDRYESASASTDNDVCSKSKEVTHINSNS